jgi:hypothetical protein
VRQQRFVSEANPRSALVIADDEQAGFRPQEGIDQCAARRSLGKQREGGGA